MRASLIMRLLKRKTALLGLMIIAFVVAFAFTGAKLSGADPNTPDYSATYQPPGHAHWLGTDSLGRDLLARVAAGARISLKIAFAAALINLFVGVVYGAISGYAGGAVDSVMMRFVDILYGVPTILVVIMLMVYLEQGIRNIYLAIGLTYWLNMARLVRGEVLSLKERDFVHAARALGAGVARIIGRHVLPNAAGVILVTLTLFIPEAIFTEAFLSYIGLGVPAPDASWGSLAADGTKNLQAAPWLLVVPAAAISLTILAFNLVGDALRDAITEE